MQILLEFAPLIAFFAAYKFVDIYFATGVLIIGLFLQIGFYKLTGKPIPKMLLWSAVLAAALGSITIFFRDPIFIQWKASVLYWGMAAAIIIARLISGRSTLQRMLEPMLIEKAGATGTVPNTIWRASDWLWTLSLTSLGVLNIWIAKTFSEAVWVNFKVFGAFGVTLVLIFGQIIWLSRYLDFPETEASDVDNSDT